MAFERLFVEDTAQILELADRTANFHRIAAVQGRDAGRIVTTIFETTKPADENRGSVTRTYIAYYSTHTRLF
jgi:hypothetical protein